MTSAWSSADPSRRRLFLAGLAMIVVLFGWIGYELLTAPASKPPRQTQPGSGALTTSDPSAPPESVIAVPPGHEGGDDGTAPPTPDQPQELPPRFGQPPELPVSDVDLKAASDVAMTFLEAFANGRWQDRPDEKIQQIQALVLQPSVDLVLAQFESVRAKPASHEAVTYRVTGAKWWSLSDGQVTLLVSGDRRVVDDTGDRTGVRAFLVTLVRASGTWKVSSVRDPSAGDTGMGTS
jgi:hypothetical protein